MLNLCVAVGVLYAKVAITNDVPLAKNLLIARSTICVLNVASVFQVDGQLPPAPIFQRRARSCSVSPFRTCLCVHLVGSPRSPNGIALPPPISKL